MEKNNEKSMEKNSLMIDEVKDQLKRNALIASIASKSIGDEYVRIGDKSRFIPPFMVILLGPDRIGKDTFVTTLYTWMKDKFKYGSFVVNRFNSPVELSLDEKVESDDRNLRESLNMLNSGSNVVVLNRSYLDEYVYGQLYRNMSVESVSYYSMLEKKYGLDQYDNIFLVHLYASPSFCTIYNYIDCMDNMYYKRQSYFDLVEKFSVELKLFRDVFEGSMIKNKVKINVSNKRKDYSFKDKRKILGSFLEVLYPYIRQNIEK